MRKIREIGALVLYNWKALAGFELIYKFASGLLFLPLLWNVFDWIMEAGGYTYLTLENIVPFLTQPFTVVSLFFLLLLAAAYAMIEISAIVFVIDQSKQKYKVHFQQILKFSVKNAARVWKRKNFFLVLVVLLLIPFLNIGLGSSILTTISIPEFILDYIAANEILSLLLCIVTVLLLVLMMRWLYAFHYFTLEGCSFAEARKKSAQLGRKKRFRDLRALLWVQFVSAVFLVLFFIAVVTAALAVTSLFSSEFVLQWVASTVIWMMLLFAITVAGMLAGPFSYGCVSVLYYRHKEEAGEAPVYSKAPQYNQRGFSRGLLRCMYVLAGCIVVAGSFGLGYLLCSGKLNPQIEYIRTMEITAHRGASAFYPENTMAAFVGAKELGADWIELDVQQCKDGQIIVIHDSNLQRTTGVNRNTWDMTYEEIAKLDAGSFFDPVYAGEKIPLLSEVVQFAKERDIKLNIELKPTGHETEFEKCVVDIIRSAGMERECVITSQVYEVLERVKAYDESVQTVYVMSLAYGDINRLTAADHFSVEATSATESLVSRVHNAGKQIYAWTVNTQDSIHKMIEKNVDNIITDDIELAKQCVYESRYSDLLTEYMKLFE